MESDTPSASWHPAMMPNSHAEMPPSHLSKGEADEQGQSTKTTALNDGNDSQPAAIPDDSDNKTAAQAGGVLDQFNDEDPEAGGWSLSSQAEHDAEAHEPESAAPLDEAPHQDIDDESSVPMSKAAKHFSTMSCKYTNKNT